MKKRSNNWIRILVVSLMMMLILPCQLVFASTTQVKFDKEEVKVLTNESFTLTLKGDALKDVYGFEIALSFNPDQIEIVGKPVVKFVEGFSAGPTRASDGKVYFGFTQIGQKEGKSGTIELGNFTFKSKVKGTHEIKLESIKIVDSKMGSKDYKIGQVIKVDSKGNGKADKLKDIKGHWAEQSIAQIVELGYMVGKTEDMFMPNDKLTRGEMATILSRLVEPSQVGNVSFKDIAGDEWYAQNILTMANKGLLSGYEDGTFKPKGNITRAETIVILARMEKENNTYVAPENVAQILSRYKDANKVPAWAQEEIAWAIEKGLIKGDTNNNLNMQSNITRAETAVILCRVLGLE